MKRATLILLLAASLPAAAAAQSVHPPPYAKLAADLATPNLVSSAGPADKSLLKLRFVGASESEANWVKMTSISIAKVKPADTQTATRSIITKFKTSLEGQKQVKIVTYDVRPTAQSTAFFEFVTTSGVAEQGIAYSPAEGFVSVIQVAYKHGYAHRAADRSMLQAVIAR